MTIDHGKLLALADEIASTRCDSFLPASLIAWERRIRALAQPAEAVEDSREVGSLYADASKHDAAQGAVDPKDLQVSIWPEPPKTGLRVGMSSGVMILHKPTGLVVCYDRERSQHRNRQRALAALTAALSQPKEENDGR